MAPKLKTPTPKMRPAKNREFAEKAKAPRKPRATPTKPSAPPGETKSQMLIGMMKRTGGATSKQMEEATGWAPHSVRGLIGTLKKRGTVVVSTKDAGSPTVYHIPAEDVI